MDMQDKKRAVEAAKVALANAEEGFRLASITYDAGMNTITDVQDAQIRCYQAGQAVAKAITDYDLAIYAFKHAIGVGTTEFRYSFGGEIMRTAAKTALFMAVLTLLSNYGFP